MIRSFYRGRRRRRRSSPGRSAGTPSARSPSSRPARAPIASTGRPLLVKMPRKRRGAVRRRTGRRGRGVTCRDSSMPLARRRKESQTRPTRCERGRARKPVSTRGAWCSGSPGAAPDPRSCSARSAGSSSAAQAPKPRFCGSGHFLTTRLQTVSRGASRESGRSGWLAGRQRANGASSAVRIRRCRRSTPC